MDDPAAFDLDDAMAVLERTPAVLRGWLSGLPRAWIEADEGPETWNAWRAYMPVIDDRETPPGGGS
jgi:hypothetical protein